MDRLQKLKGQLIQKSTDTVYDYIIVGAGVAGVQAGELLAQNGKNFLILEAQTIFGGRISTIIIGQLPETAKTKWVQSNPKVAKFNIEKGATWIESGHEFIFALCKQFGVDLREQYAKGNNIYVSKDKVFTHKELMTNPEIGTKLFDAVKKFQSLSDMYDKKVLKNKNKGKEYSQLLRLYDSMTISEYMKNQIPSEFVRGFLQNIIEHSECADCQFNSMHEVLMKNACSNDIQIVKEFLGEFTHESSFLINGGTERIIEAFLKRMQAKTRKPRSELVISNCPVTAIDNTQPIIKITADHNGQQRTFQCRKVIMSVPIAVIKEIKISKLSPGKQLIFNNQLETTSRKSFVICQRPFWQKLGWSGDCLFSADYNINMAHDISPHDGSCGILVFFHNATKLKAWENHISTHKDPHAEKRQFFVQLLAKMFLNGDTRNPELQSMVFVDNSFAENKYIRSCFQSNTKAGVFSKLLDIGDSLDAYYRNENGLIFAGSEYSDEFASYIEGAIRSARKQVHRELGLVDQLARQIEQANKKL